MAERHEAIFVQIVNSQAIPSVAGLPSPEQAIATQAFLQLRGLRFKAFLSDLGAVARRDNTVDILQSYALGP